MMAPHLVADRETSNGRVIARYHDHVLSRVMSRSAAAQVTDGMIFVVDHGSGWPDQIKGMKVAGKTGTAESGRNKPHAWFIAFAPAQHPVVAVAVLREYSGEGFQYAAPVARKVLIAALREHGYRVQ
jgi:peptidoglycan glycosyltransferase